MTKRWGPNTKSDLTQTKRAAAKRARKAAKQHTDEDLKSNDLDAIRALIAEPEEG